MKYLLSKQFTQIAETTGTIQNSSHVGTIEMSNSDTPDSGILIYPLQKVSFNDKTIYLRCIDGYAEARVLPFELDMGRGDSSSSTIPAAPTQDDKSKYLIVDLPFAQDFNDNCGGTWSTVGSPTIGDNALQLNGSSYIVKSGGITLGGRDFTVSYGAFADSAQAMQPVFSFTVNENSNSTYRIFSYLRHDSSGKLHAGLCGDSSTATSFDQDYRGQLHNFLHVYDHSNCTFATYVDGVLVATQTNIAIAQTNYPYCRIATAPSLSEAKFKGYITEFKVYDGVALYPESFHNGSSDTQGGGGSSDPTPVDPNSQYLIVDSPFSTDLTDNCGVVWNSNGTVTVSNGAAQFNQSYLQSNDQLTFGGQDFTIRFYGYMNSSSPSYTAMFGAQKTLNSGEASWSGMFYLQRVGSSSNGLLALRDANSQWLNSTKADLTFNNFLDVRHHFEFNYFQSSHEIKMFLDGTLIITDQLSAEFERMPRYLFFGVNTYAFTQFMTGTISNFQIYDGVALHSENFTPE